ncbi:MAG: hypothetical protein IT535_12325 [Bauldia sp.]|nr:hypothetical protein [Bauldia sp.]
MSRSSTRGVSRRALLAASVSAAAAMSAIALMPGGVAEALRAAGGRPGQALGQAIIDRVGLRTAVALVREHEAVFAGASAESLSGAIAADFRAGRTMRVDGWMLSRTECAACVASVLAT